MSFAEDYNYVATGPVNELFAGASLFNTFAVPQIALAAEFGLTQLRFSLGRTSNFREAFQEEAEANGFTIVPIVLSTDFFVDWSNP